MLCYVQSWFGLMCNAYYNQNFVLIILHLLYFATPHFSVGKRNWHLSTMLVICNKFNPFEISVIFLVSYIAFSKQLPSHDLYSCFFDITLRMPADHLQPALT